MNTQDTWDRLMTPFTPNDFPSEHSLRNALQKLILTLPEWNITEQQQQQIVEHWKAHRT